MMHIWNSMDNEPKTKKKSDNKPTLLFLYTKIDFYL